MSGEGNGGVVVRAGGGEKPDIQVSVHIHLDGAGNALGAPPVAARGQARSWAAPVLVIMIAAGAVVLLGRVTNHNGGAVAPVAAASTAQAAPQQTKEAADGQMPAQVSAALKEKPVIVPPPGAPSAEAQPSGPAAFGLGE
jgi:hypothetical protein